MDELLLDALAQEDSFCSGNGKGLVDGTGAKHWAAAGTKGTAAGVGADEAAGVGADEASMGVFWGDGVCVKSAVAATFCVSNLGEWAGDVDGDECLDEAFSSAATVCCLAKSIRIGGTALGVEEADAAASAIEAADD